MTVDYGIPWWAVYVIMAAAFITFGLLFGLVSRFTLVVLELPTLTSLVAL